LIKNGIEVFKFNYGPENLIPGRPYLIKISKDKKSLILIPKDKVIPTAQFINFNDVKGLLFGALSSTFQKYHQEVIKSLLKETDLHKLDVERFIDWKL
jgi:hypothetical protein